MGVDDGAEGTGEAGVDRRAHGLAQAELLANALEDQDVRVHGHADREHDAGDAGERERRAEGGHGRQQDQHVEDERDVGDEPRDPIVDDHEQHDGGGARHHREHALTDRVGPERGPHRALLEDPHRRRQGAGPEHDGQVARLVDRKLSGDDGSPAGDALVDARRRVEVAVQDDRQPAADVLLRRLAEDARPHRVELDRDLPVAGRVRVRRDLGAVQLGPREQRLLLDDVGNLGLGLRLPVHSPLVEDLVALGELARQRLLGGRPIVDELELEQRGLADERLRALRVLDPRELDEDPVLALARDRGLGHAELVDPVPDRLDALPNGEVRDPPHLAIGQREREAPRRLVERSEVVAAEVSGRGRGLAPGLGRRELHDDLVVVPGHAGDGDALLLERALEVRRRPVQLALDRLLDLDAKDEMHAAPEIEAQVDGLPGGVEIPERGGGDDGDETDTSPEVPTHLGRAVPPPLDRPRTGRIRA